MHSVFVSSSFKHVDEVPNIHYGLDDVDSCWWRLP